MSHILITCLFIYHISLVGGNSVGKRMLMCYFIRYFYSDFNPMPMSFKLRLKNKTLLHVSMVLLKLCACINVV